MEHDYDDNTSTESVAGIEKYNVPLSCCGLTVPREPNGIDGLDLCCVSKHTTVLREAYYRVDDPGPDERYACKPPTCWSYLSHIESLKRKAPTADDEQSGKKPKVKEVIEINSDSS
jgi:hypothetical protein